MRNMIVGWISSIIRMRKPNYNSSDIMQISIDSFDKHIAASHLVWPIAYNGHAGYFKSCIDAKNINEKYDYLDVQRKMAYEALAVLFGGDRFILHAQYATANVVTDSGVLKVHGSFQERSPGFDIWFTSRDKRIEMITPDFQLAVSWLRLFDVIAREEDHSLNNYQPVADDSGNYISICAFDNGSAGSFPLNSRIEFN